MKITPVRLITTASIAFLACKFVFFVDVKNEVQAQLKEAFPDEFVVNVDAAHYNLLTKRITVKEIEFPSTGATVDRLSFTNLAEMDTLPDSVSFSASGVKGIPALLAKQFPDLDWSNVTAALIKDGIKEGDADTEFSIRVERSDNDVVISIFYGMAYVHNFSLTVTLGDVHSVFNGSFGRLVRAKRLNGESDGVFAGVIDVVKGLPESRGMNVDILQVDFSHTVVGLSLIHISEPTRPY